MGGCLKIFFAINQRTMDGGDLKTLPRQHGGMFGLLGKMFGFGPGDLQKQMSDPIKQQMMMQRGGFPWALAGLSLLPMLMGKGQEDRIRNQMKVTRDSIMQRGGLAIPPALISKGIPLLKQIGIPVAMGALASLGDNVMDKIFGDGNIRRTKGVRTGVRKRRSERYSENKGCTENQRTDKERLQTQEGNTSFSREGNRFCKTWVTSWQQRQEIRSRSS